MRNGYNVAHNLMLYNKLDTNRAIGQHSNSFDYVIPHVGNLSILSKLMILNYAFPQKYEYDWQNNSWHLRQSVS